MKSFMDAEYRVGGKKIPTFEECIDAIQTRYNDLKKTNDILHTENIQLKSEHYKDEELMRLREELDEYKQKYLEAFSISDGMREWIEFHKMRCKYPTFTYSFTPTYVGICNRVYCSYCDSKYEEFD